MHRLQVKHRFVLKYSAVWLFFIPIVIATLPFGFAGEKEDKAAAIALITIIESGKTGQADFVDFGAIPMRSKKIACFGDCRVYTTVSVSAGRYQQAKFG